MCCIQNKEGIELIPACNLRIISFCGDCYSLCPAVSNSEILFYSFKDSKRWESLHVCSVSQSNVKGSACAGNIFVTFHYRLTNTLDCELDLTYFPLDYQNCSVEIESCKLNCFNTFLIYAWSFAVRPVTMY